ncbi:MAG: stage III sporulation protein AB [Oscillospiraceae bacterium]|nr:stage III sporulation protein AB [Oscillospiraceae bacterium]
MFKLWGMVMLWGSFAAAGFFADKRLKARVKDIEKCILTARIIEDELKHSLAPVGQIMDLLLENPLLRDFEFLHIYKSLNKSYTSFNKALLQAVKLFKGALNEDDRAIFSQLALILGKSTAESQLNAISSILIKLEHQRCMALEYEQKHGKMYRSLGMLGGAAVCLVLI